MVNAEKMGRKTKNVGDDPTCYHLTFMCC